MAIIKTTNLTKKFKDLIAVDNVSLEVEESECFGLLGPNGAGKTSLIRMVTAVSPPTSGDIWVMGRELKKYPREVKAILATPSNIEDVTAGEIFWGATRSLMTGMVVLAIAAAFQLVPSPWAMLVLPVAFLEGIMFAAIALFFTSIVPSMYTFNYYFTLFISPMFFLGGVFFPLTSFPKILQTLSWVAPLTPAANLARSLFQGEFHLEMLLALGIIIVYAAVFFPISPVAMRRLTK
jgi:Nod factor-specific ABC transporter NodJ protein